MIPLNEKEIRAKLTPAIKRLVEDANKLEMNLSGFVFDSDLDLLIRFGNVGHVQGPNLIRMHWGLATVATELEAEGHYSVSDETLGTLGQDPLEIADKLALSVIACPSDAVPARVREYAENFAEMRKNA